MFTQFSVLKSIVFIGLILLTGLAMFGKGRPYPMLPVTLHKLMSIAALIYFFYSLKALAGPQSFGLPHWIMIGSFALLFVLAVVSGGLLTINKFWSEGLLLAHRILFLAVMGDLFILLKLLRS